MNSIPLYHLSPTGRAAIDAESARIRLELAARRAERESRLRPMHLLDDMDQTTLPRMVTPARVGPAVEGGAVDG
jgi:hypothetical protein